MTFDLRAALPQLIPKAIAWAEGQSSLAAQSGWPLDAMLVSVAESVGVLHPQRIRRVEVSRLPVPDDQELQQAALATGLLGPSMIGLTLGYGVFVCRGHGTVRLFSHEFRHVYQYEQAGSIAAFLPVYLQQIVTDGYSNAPLEMDARAHEQSSV